MLHMCGFTLIGAYTLKTFGIKVKLIHMTRNKKHSVVKVVVEVTQKRQSPAHKIPATLLVRAIESAIKSTKFFYMYTTTHTAQCSYV